MGDGTRFLHSMARRSRRQARAARLLGPALALGALAVLPALSGCRVSKGDVTRWEKTERGPYKLIAVVTHDKYAPDLRVEAALSLVRMPPRGGQRKGIGYLVDKYKDEDGEQHEGALTRLPEGARRQIVNGMAVELVRQMNIPPPPRDEKTDRSPPDPTVPYKDMAFALLTHEPTSLVSDEKTRADLIQGLITWAQTGFEDRVENSAQQYGLEQMMRFLGAPSVRKLPDLLTEKARRIDRMCALISDLGDEDTKKRAGEALVALARTTTSPQWVARWTTIVTDSNTKNKSTATAEQVAGQVQKIQDRHLNEEIFPSMKKVGGRVIVDYLLEFAANAKNSDDRRKTALAALDGRLDKNSAADMNAIFAIAKEESTSDIVRDLAFQRLQEFPKDQIVLKLYTLFDQPKKWKVRWVAGDLILKTITNPKQVPDFLKHLPTKSTTKMGMTEPLGYAQRILKMESSGDVTPHSVMAPYLDSKDFGPKMTAIGMYWEGKKADRGHLAKLENDKTPVPKCDPEDDCQWSCDAPKEPGSKEMVKKEVSTIGEVVKICVIPSMEK